MHLFTEKRKKMAYRMRYLGHLNEKNVLPSSFFTMKIWSSSEFAFSEPWWKYHFSLNWRRSWREKCDIVASSMGFIFSFRVGRQIVPTNWLLFWHLITQVVIKFYPYALLLQQPCPPFNWCFLWMRVSLHSFWRRTCDYGNNLRIWPLIVSQSRLVA